MENDSFIQRLYNWAETSEEPLCSYATGLLGAAMDVQDIAVAFRTNNARLVPEMLRKLDRLQQADKSGSKTGENGSNVETQSAPGTSQVTQTSRKNSICMGDDSNDAKNTSNTSATDLNRPFARFGSESVPSSPEMRSPIHNGTMTKFRNTINLSSLFENSQQSCDYKYTRNTIPIYPATNDTYRMLTLRYLTSLGEYQEFLLHVSQYNALKLIFHDIENVDPKCTCLAFEALKYLASLLCHKKFSLEFINRGGLEVINPNPYPNAFDLIQFD